MFRFLITSALTVSILTTVLPRKAEANEAVAGIVGGMVGLMVGSAIQANAQQQRQCYAYHQMTQTLLMREVLQNYVPAYHAQFEEYVLIDLEGWLSNRQQQQLLDIMAQRHIAHCCAR